MKLCKRFLACLLVAAMLVANFPAVAHAEGVTGTYEGLTYEIADGAVTITDCDAVLSGDLVIPATIGGYPVTTIGYYAFAECSRLTSVTIPEGVTTIGKWAFYYCTSLTTVTIPSSVTTIGDYAFSWCGSLTTVTIPSGVTTIGEGAFSYCNSLTTVTIPSSATTIGEGAFYCCHRLTTVTIPEGVTTIGASAFYDCYGLTTVTIPEGVTTIGGSAFSGCSSLTTVTIPSSVTTIGSYAFNECGSLTDVYYGGSDYQWAQITIAEYNAQLTNATLHTAEPVVPAGITYEIADGAVTITGYTDELSGDLVIPATIGGYPVTTIGRSAFSSCSSLTSVTIPDSVTTVGGSAFYNCDSLTTVTIGNGVTTIGNYAFDYCSSLTGIWVDADNANYSSDAQGVLFNKDKTELIQAPRGITGSYTIPDSVTAIGYEAFAYCTSLTSVTIPGSVTTIVNRAFYNCSSLTSVTIPDSVTHVWHYTFSGCDQLAYTVYDNAKYLGNTENPYHALIGSTSDSITSVEIHPDTKVIAGEAFEDCSSLTTVTIPDSVTAIRYEAFEGCSRLTDIYYGGTPSQWDEIAVGEGNEPLLYATLHTVLPAGITYEIADGAVTITNCDPGLSGDLVIPATIEGYPVTTIGQRAFSWCDSLTSVTIPGSVATIGYEAFAGCHSLTTVTIPEGVTTIGEAAFYDCVNLSSVTIPDSVTTIGDEAFAECYSLTSVTIGSGVTTIGGSAFYWCCSLTSVTIGNGVTTIGEDAFGYCSSLTSVTIPGSVTTIGDSAFSECSNLTDVYYSGTGMQWARINIGDDNDYLTDATLHAELVGVTYEIIDGAVTITDYTDELSSDLVIPATIEGYPVTTIGDNAFSWCDSLTSVTIPDSVTTIGEWAFEECLSLTSVTIPSSVTTIGEAAFIRCGSLTSVTIPSSVTTIGVGAFEECVSLTGIWVDADNANYSSDAQGVMFNKDKTELILSPGGITGSYTIPDSVTTIGGWAFYWCDSLTTVTIPEGVTTIGEGAFYECTSLTTVTIPDSVTTIGERAFSFCYGLTDVYYGGTADQWDAITVGSGNELLTSANLRTRVPVTYKIEGGEVTITGYTEALNGDHFIPETIEGYPVTAIGANAFEYCDAISIKLPDSITSIGDYAFYRCESLTTLMIPDSVTSVGEDAFYGCSSLTDLSCGGIVYKIAEGKATITGYTGALGDTLVIPETIAGYPVTAIADRVFYNCTSLTSVTMGDGVTTIGDYAFYGCTSLTSVTMGDGVTTIGDHAFSNCDSLTSVTIPGDVTTIGDYAFYNCDGLTSVRIPGSVISIGERAFYNCTGLVSVTMEEGVTTIGDWAFSSCDSLMSAQIPGSVTFIGEGAFSFCDKLTSVEIPDSVTTIEVSAFSSCAGLEGIWVDPNNANYCSDEQGVLFNRNKTKLLQAPGAISGSYSIPETVTDIGEYAFYACGGLTSVTIPEGVTVIGEATFSYCDGLTTVIIPEGVTTIGLMAFNGCSEMAVLTIPVSVKTIEQMAFSNCTGLTDIYYGGTASQWDAIRIGDQWDNILTGKSAFYKATRHYTVLTGITVNTVPNKTEYMAGEKLDTTGLTLTATYSNGLTGYDRVITEGFTVSGYHPTKVGEQTVTVSLDGYTTTFTIKVKVSAIKINNKTVKTEYWVGEALDTANMALTVTYSDGSTRTITEGFTVTGFDPNTTGVQTLTVTYGEATDTYEVVVRKAIIRDTLQEAIRDCVEEFDRIRLEGNVEETVVLDKDVELDLNGFHIKGEITGSGKLHLVDSKTDDFTVRDGEGYGKVSLELGAHIVPGKGYVKITEADGVSVHKVKLDVKSMSLRPENAGLYFKSDFAGDEVVAEHVTSFGVALSVTGAPDESTFGNSKHFTRFGKEFFGSDSENTSTLLTGVLKPTNGYLTNQRNSRMKVYGRAYIEIDGVITFGECRSRSLQEQVEGMDGIWDQLSTSQKNGALELYNQYRQLLRTWNIPNLKNAAK